MNEHDYHIVSMMEKYGGSFVKALANACHHADPINLAKLKNAFPEYWKEYEEMFDEYETEDHEKSD